MSLTLTLIILALSLALIVLANWRERRPTELGKAPLIPYPMIQVIGVVIAILMLAHLVSLTTGQQLKGRQIH